MWIIKPFTPGISCHGLSGCVPHTYGGAFPGRTALHAGSTPKDFKTFSLRSLYLSNWYSTDNHRPANVKKPALSRSWKKLTLPLCSPSAHQSVPYISKKTLFFTCTYFCKWSSGNWNFELRKTRKFRHTAEGYHFFQGVVLRDRSMSARSWGERDHSLIA